MGTVCSVHYPYTQHSKYFLVHLKYRKLFDESIKRMWLGLFKAAMVIVKLLAVKEKIYLLKTRNSGTIKIFIRYCYSLKTLL